jgi:hypothetical protein
MSNFGFTTPMIQSSDDNVQSSSENSINVLNFNTATTTTNTSNHSFIIVSIIIINNNLEQNKK